MNVSGIFKLLITAVACVLVGAFVLNMVVPNALTVIIDNVEGTIFKATGISLDINANSVDGEAAANGSAVSTGGVESGAIQGFSEEGGNVKGLD